MVDGPAREIPERDSDSHAFAHWYIDDVSPSPEAWAPFIFADDLERIGVDVERMIEIHHHHSTSVNDLPLLDGSDPDSSVDPFRVKRRSVDCERVSPHAHHAVSEHRLFLAKAQLALSESGVVVIVHFAGTAV